MDFTGERYIPKLEGEIEMEHMHRYLFALQVSKGAVVLDIASGEGYGSFLLSQNAQRVIGVDISNEAISHATKTYSAANLEFIVGSCDSIPLADESVDLIVSFETIEHHNKHHEMMREFKRVLKPEGILIMSSPDKQNYSVEPNFKNEYHVLELYETELKNLVGNYFKCAEYFGQKSISCSVISPDKSNFLTNFESYYQNELNINRVAGINKPIYWIVCASDGDLPDLSTGIYESKKQLFRELEGKEVELAVLRREAEFKQELIYDQEVTITGHKEVINELNERLTELGNRIERRKIKYWVKKICQRIIKL